MPDILLTTINARFAHASLALRSLLANLGHLEKQSTIHEFVLGGNIRENASALLQQEPKIIGISVSIWNAVESAALVALLKAVSPETILILGGPEVSHQPLRLDFSPADYCIAGEGEHAFRDLCTKILEGNPPEKGLIKTIPVDPKQLAFPYSRYSNFDLQNRTTYVESSRGCPFHCKFCLSSLDPTVRYFDLDDFLLAMETLWQRGGRHYKFIDRTFNLDIPRAIKILEFFLQKEPPYLVHFEAVPEQFPEPLKECLRRFPAGVLQLEIGIQTLDPAVATRIGRQMDMEKIKSNLRFLDEETNAHLHTDLIIGLPGESAEGFGAGLDTLRTLTDGEIQLGILKKLSGTTLGEMDQQYGMVWEETPPYAILQNDLLPFQKMQELTRMARYWDLVYNSGNFKNTIPLLLTQEQSYEPFFAFSRWLFSRSQTTWHISLNRLAQYIFEFLTEIQKNPQTEVAISLAEDLHNATGKTPPPFLRKWASGIKQKKPSPPDIMLKRQRKHG